VVGGKKRKSEVNTRGGCRSRALRVRSKRRLARPDAQTHQWQPRSSVLSFELAAGLNRTMIALATGTSDAKLRKPTHRSAAALDDRGDGISGRFQDSETFQRASMISPITPPQPFPTPGMSPLLGVAAGGSGLFSAVP